MSTNGGRDDLDLQEFLKLFLKSIGFGRVVAGTAKDAIHCQRKQKFGLMFLDLQLPDVPGDQVYYRQANRSRSK